MPLKKDKFHHLLHEGCGSLEKSWEKTPGHFWSQKDTSMTQYMVFGVKVKLFWSLAPKSNSLTTATRWWNGEPIFQFCYWMLVYQGLYHFSFIFKQPLKLHMDSINVEVWPLSGRIMAKSVESATEGKMIRFHLNNGKSLIIAQCVKSCWTLVNCGQ